MVQKPGTMKCNVCKGKGCLDVEITCNKCNGEGVLDWIENVVGVHVKSDNIFFNNNTDVGIQSISFEELIDGIMQEHNLRLYELEERLQKLETLVEDLRKENKR